MVDAFGQDARARAIELYAHVFGTHPQAVARAPGRVNLIGDHTDYSGGCVLPMAIDRDCVCALDVSRNSRHRLVVRNGSSEPIMTHEFPVGAAWRAFRGTNAPESFVRGSWVSYVAGVLAVFEESITPGEMLPGLQIALASDVPLGSGLSSSASLEVCVARALCQRVGAAWDAHRAAGWCRRAEHEFAGVPCGIMDQLVSAGASAGHALMIECGEPVRTRPIRMPAASRASVVVIDTTVRHSLASGEYAQRERTCREAEKKLGVSQLGELDAATRPFAHPALSDEERRRVRHVVTENQRVRDAAVALETGDLIGFGRLMNESHESLRDEYRVSCVELDSVVSAARSVNGVFGARMTGGGFGGCAVCLMEPGAMGEATRAVAQAAADRGWAKPRVFQVNAAAGASVLS